MCVKWCNQHFPSLPCQKPSEHSSTHTDTHTLTQVAEWRVRSERENERKRVEVTASTGDSESGTAIIRFVLIAHS